MSLFWEFFTFELKFRLKSLSTYVYFFDVVRLQLSLCGLGKFRTDRIRQRKSFAERTVCNRYVRLVRRLFSALIVIAAIFGTSILRDFQRDTYQILFTKPISKFAYLGGRWAGSFVTTVFAFSGLMFGTFLGTFAPWADHLRIGPNHPWWYLQPFLSIVVVQIFFLGSLFFAVAALSRKIFVVYLQGVALFMLYVIGITVFSATRSLERFWSGIFDPVGLLLFDDITRYWTVAEKNVLSLSWSPHVAAGVFLYNRLFWLSVGCVSLAAVWVLFPMSVEALTASRTRAPRRQGEAAGRVRGTAQAFAGGRAASQSSPGFRIGDDAGRSSGPFRACGSVPSCMKSRSGRLPDC